MDGKEQEKTSDSIAEYTENSESENTIPKVVGEEENRANNSMAPPNVLQHVPFPSKLELLDDSTKAADWELFRQIWDNYEISSGLDEHPKQRRTATLLTCFSPSALQIFNAITFENEADKKDIDIVLRKMSDFCKGTINETYERYLFNIRAQEAGESIDNFYSALLRQARNCSFGDLEKSLIRDRIVVGVQENTVRKRLLQSENLTLQECLKIARSFEVTDLQLKSMQKDAEVCFVKKKSKEKSSSTSATTDEKPTRSYRYNEKCFCCGQERYPRKFCPARDAIANRE